MTETEIVHVDLADRSYDIVIGDGVLARAGALIRDIVGGDACIIILKPAGDAAKNHCGDAQPVGLVAARFLTAMVCLGEGVYRLSGVPRMHERPQKDLILSLRALGYRVDPS